MLCLILLCCIVCVISTEEVILNEERTTDEEKMKIIEGLTDILLSSPRFDFPSWFFSIPYILSTTIISIPLFLHLVLLAPRQLVCIAYYLVLSFLLMYSSS